jgi:hypothetical protein
MGTIEELWLSQAAAPTCATHRTTNAEIICRRCGTFSCGRCALLLVDGCCPPCTEALLRDSLPLLGRAVAWKLALLPVFTFVSLAALTLREGHPPEQAWLLLWVVPLLCALRLLVQPSASVAWAGTLVSLALFAAQVLPGAFEAELTTHRAIELVLLAAAPLAAIASSGLLGRTAARLRAAQAY